MKRRLMEAACSATTDAMTCVIGCLMDHERREESGGGKEVGDDSLPDAHSFAVLFFALPHQSPHSVSVCPATSD